ncbi:hypothetical protein HK097_009150 [Rhizophlyctis rosea]|uniref:Uncharacterized protein n=1 Tax=Rhizophlyctis rosea TaxID=64517 RepID=A0AAD5X4S8_9FUNG|nr:hypothetical protein HK097_009150 [Rhizophlyctis rosea]
MPLYNDPENVTVLRQKGGILLLSEYSPCLEDWLKENALPTDLLKSQNSSIWNTLVKRYIEALSLNDSTDFSRPHLSHIIREALETLHPHNITFHNTIHLPWIPQVEDVLKYNPEDLPRKMKEHIGELVNDHLFMAEEYPANPDAPFTPHWIDVDVTDAEGKLFPLRIQLATSYRSVIPTVVRDRDTGKLVAVAGMNCYNGDVMLVRPPLMLQSDYPDIPPYHFQILKTFRACNTQYFTLMHNQPFELLITFIAEIVHNVRVINWLVPKKSRTALPTALYWEAVKEDEPSGRIPHHVWSMVAEYDERFLRITRSGILRGLRPWDSERRKFQAFRDSG